MGRATRLLLWAHAESSFQSTPSVGRATRCADWDNRHHKISIHALRGEGDSAHLGFNIHIDRFQSTPSVGRATNVMLICLHHILISIHALRGEGDKCDVDMSASYTDFNPRPPWGGRLDCLVCFIQFALFQSTPSVGRATIIIMSIVIVGVLFQSTPSVGRATVFLCISLYRSVISIHALRGEGDTISPAKEVKAHISIHALRGEGDK